MELSDRHPIFIGIKLDGALRRELAAVEGSDRKYVSDVDSTFLRYCRQGEDLYVGKVVEGELTTDRVDDVRRNVLSILRRLCPDFRLPERLEVRVCLPEFVAAPFRDESPD